MANLRTIEIDAQDYPMFVGIVDSNIVVLCRSNPTLSASAARETGRMFLEAATKVDAIELHKACKQYLH